MPPMPTRWLLLLLATTMLAAGCASKPEKEMTERELYNEARKQLDRGNFQSAETDLQELETRFPFGRYSEQAQLDLIYARMRAVDYPSAESTAARFLRQNPGHAHTDYVLYLKGLANLWMNNGVLERRSPANPALRDLSGHREAFRDFGTLVARHPDSPYAADARARMLSIRNLLAESEVATAWYYMGRGACVAASRRARQVLADFPTAPAQADALVIAAECHRRLGEPQAAAGYEALLKLNFPEHPRLAADGTLRVPEGRNATGPSWLEMLSFGLVGRGE